VGRGREALPVLFCAYLDLLRTYSGWFGLIKKPVALAAATTRRLHWCKTSQSLSPIDRSADAGREYEY
jgi:hypothetical protein